VFTSDTNIEFMSLCGLLLAVLLLDVLYTVIGCMLRLFIYSIYVYIYICAGTGYVLCNYCRKFRLKSSN
jgi:hypothetical protein